MIPCYYNKCTDRRDADVWGCMRRPVSDSCDGMCGEWPDAPKIDVGCDKKLIVSGAKFVKMFLNDLDDALTTGLERHATRRW